MPRIRKRRIRGGSRVIGLRQVAERRACENAIDPPLDAGWIPLGMDPEDLHAEITDHAGRHTAAGCSVD